MSKYALFLACFMIPATARAQDELIKDFSAPQVEKFIKEVMKAEVKKRINDKDKMIIYSTPDGEFDIWLPMSGTKAIHFVYDFGKLKSSPQHNNDWNITLRFTRACTLKSGNASLLASLDTEAGLTFRQLTTFYQQIQGERRRFEEFIKTKPGQEK